jgi:hypothetical protein
VQSSFPIELPVLVVVEVVVVLVDVVVGAPPPPAAPAPVVVVGAPPVPVLDDPPPAPALNSPPPHAATPSTNEARQSTRMIDPPRDGRYSKRRAGGEPLRQTERMAAVAASRVVQGLRFTRPIPPG